MNLDVPKSAVTLALIALTVLLLAVATLLVLSLRKRRGSAA